MAPAAAGMKFAMTMWISAQRSEAVMARQMVVAALTNQEACETKKEATVITITEQQNQRVEPF